MELKTKILIASVVFNVVLLAAVITLAFGKGVKINSPDKLINERHIHDHREMFQGQMIIQQWLSQGNAIEWVFVKIPHDGSATLTMDKMIKFLNDTLLPMPPQNSYYHKITNCVDGEVLYYPNFIQKNK